MGSSKSQSHTTFNVTVKYDEACNIIEYMANTVNSSHHTWPFYFAWYQTLFDSSLAWVVVDFVIQAIITLLCRAVISACLECRIKTHSSRIIYAWGR